MFLSDEFHSNLTSGALLVDVDSHNALHNLAGHYFLCLPSERDCDSHVGVRFCGKELCLFILNDAIVTRSPNRSHMILLPCLRWFRGRDDELIVGTTIVRNTQQNNNVKSF